MFFRYNFIKKKQRDMREFYTQVEEGSLVKIEVELEAQQMIDESVASSNVAISGSK